VVFTENMASNIDNLGGGLKGRMQRSKRLEASRPLKSEAGTFASTSRGMYLPLISFSMSPFE